MCGIAGALDLRGTRRFPAERLARMAAAIQHRGPDGEGFYFAPGIAMAARRLALVDLQGGAQPVFNETREIVACCNGEIFDHDLVRQELVAAGHQLRTRCDVELWPHLWEEHGEKLFARARGQFALSLWDARTRTLVLARDRVGICPLFIAEAEGWLLWSSEIKGLLASGMLSREVDPRAIDHLFTFFCSPARRSFFAGIQSLAPGEALTCRSGQQTCQRHTDLDFPDQGCERRPVRVEQLVDELDAALRRAVTRRLSAEVPVATYLSGGVDSNIVLALTAAIRGQAPPSFTIGFDGAGTDETRQTNHSAAALGSPLTVVRMNAAEVARHFAALHHAAESPVVDTSTACLLRLAEVVREQGYKVVLTGEGADEALAGYVWFRIEKALAALDRLGAGLPSRALRALVFSMVGGRHQPSMSPHAALRTAQHDVYEPFARVRSELFTPDLARTLDPHDPYDDLDLDPKRMRLWHPLHRSLYVEYRVMLAGLLLQAKGDRITMRAGIEARYPFLDDEVIDLCASVAPEYKLRGLTEKWLLRQVARRYLPRAVADRPKTMFRAKLSSIMFGPKRPRWIDQLLSESALRRTGLFAEDRVSRERRIQTMLPMITPRRLVMDAALTAVVACQLWHHLFISRDLCELPAWTAPEPSEFSLHTVRGLAQREATA